MEKKRFGVRWLLSFPMSPECIARLLLTPGEGHVVVQVVSGEPAHQFVHLGQQCIEQSEQGRCRVGLCKPGRLAIQGVVLKFPEFSRCNEGIAQ
jgi:hypothetical protein